MIVLLGFGELGIPPYLLDLAGGQGTAKPVKKRAVTRRKAHSMRSGNEKGGNGKGWQKSRKI